MKILFDFQILVTQKFGGISRYFYELHQGFKSENDIRVQCIQSRNEYFDSIISKRFYDTDNRIKLKIIGIINRIHRFFNIIYFRPDIFHATYYDLWLIPFLPKNTKLVITIHDMIHEKYPHYFPESDQTSKRKKLACKKADLIISISENTKLDLIDCFSLDENKIKVVHHGLCQEIANRINNSSKKKNQVLFVGKRDGYKNFSFFVSSVSSIMIANSISLVCAGGGKFTKRELELFKKLGILDLVSQRSVSDQELNILYSESLFLAFPSIYEGFGLPILESWSNGTPLLLSDNSCFKEIASDAALFFKVDNNQDLKERFYELYSDEQLRNELTILGTRRLEAFSKNLMISKTMDAYKSVLNSKH